MQCNITEDLSGTSTYFWDCLSHDLLVFILVDSSFWIEWSYHRLDVLHYTLLNVGLWLQIPNKKNIFLNDEQSQMNKFHKSKHNTVTILSIANLNHYIYSRSHIIHPLNKAFQHLVKCIKYHKFDFIIEVPPLTQKKQCCLFSVHRNATKPYHFLLD